MLYHFFDADEIPAIKGNKTIFISNYDYSGSDSLRLPRRTQSFLRQKLEDNGYKNPYKLISQTNGLFYYIKHSLYEGKIASPEWSSDNNKAILTALLIGKWMESDGDKEIIEKIYNGNYSDFLEYLQQYIGNDKPFIVKHCVSLTNTFELSETFLAFQSLKGKISNDMLHSFIGEAQNVILEYDSLFEEPMDNHYYEKLYL